MKNTYKKVVVLLGVMLATLVAGSSFAGKTLHYIHSDHLGTPRVISDQRQQIVWQAEYTPFGEARVTTEIVKNNLRFPGQYYDEETGLHYNGFRYYDPKTGKYTGSDRIGLGDGPNTYNYANQNPANYYDQNGLAAETPWDIFNIGVGLAQTTADLLAGNYSDAAISGGATILDACAAIVPFVPGGFSTAVKAKRIAEKLPVAKGGGKADFIVDSNGTAVRNSANGARRDLEAGGFPGRSTTQTAESGTLHRGVPGRDGPMDVRIMGGQANGGAFKGPRIRTTRSGSANDGVRSDGSRFRNNESKSQRLRESHIHLGQ